MTFELGYALSSEEHRPRDLVRYAVASEEAGFSFACISDHFHPWTDSQGQSPFVWSVLGGVAQSTNHLRLGTGVTCPIMRTHPAVIAQAAATTAAMMPGRFFLGVGTGENLNEHITGERWPSVRERQEMLEEAVEIIRLLWLGGNHSHRGRYFTVVNARIYTLPEEPPPIIVAATGPESTDLAARIGDGLWTTAPKPELIDTFVAAGGTGPRYGKVTVCWAATEEEAKHTAHHWWPNIGIPGELELELPLPRHFEQAARLVGPDRLGEQMALGPDPERHLDAIRSYSDAGFDHVYVHQVGPDQEGFFRFYEREVLPKL